MSSRESPRESTFNWGGAFAMSKYVIPEILCLYLTVHSFLSNLFSYVNKFIFDNFGFLTTLRLVANISLSSLLQKDYVGIFFISNMNIRAFSPNLRLLFLYNSLHFAIIREFHICHSLFLVTIRYASRVFVNKDRFFLYLQSYHSMNFSFLTGHSSICLIKQFRIY